MPALGRYVACTLMSRAGTLLEQLRCSSPSSGVPLHRRWNVMHVGGSVGYLVGVPKRGLFAWKTGENLLGANAGVFIDAVLLPGGELIAQDTKGSLYGYDKAKGVTSDAQGGHGWLLGQQLVSFRQKSTPHGTYSIVVRDLRAGGTMLGRETVIAYPRHRVREATHCTFGDETIGYILFGTDRSGGASYVAVREGSTWSSLALLPQPEGATWPNIACGPRGLSVTYAVGDKDATEVTVTRCDRAARCRTQSQKIALPRRSREDAGSRIQAHAKAFAVGEKVLLLLVADGVRMRLAPLAELPTAKETLLFPHNREVWSVVRQDTAALLLDDRGQTYAMRLNPQGDMHPIRVSWEPD